MQVPQITVKLRPENAALHGLTAGQVRQAVTTLISGRKVGEVFQDQRVHDVTVWSVLQCAPTTPPCANCSSKLPAAVMSVSPMSPTSPSCPRRMRSSARASRRIDVTCNVSGRALGEVAREIEERIGKISFASGYHPQILGEWAERQAAQSRLGWLALASLAGILALLLADFQSPRLVLLIALTLPFASSAGFWPLGSVVEFSRSVRSSDLSPSSGSRRAMESSSSATIDTFRLRKRPPSVSTSSCAAARSASSHPHDRRDRRARPAPARPQRRSARERNRASMALVILGGLVTSTLLNLFLLPSLYARFGGRTR